MDAPIGVAAELPCAVRSSDEERRTPRGSRALPELCGGVRAERAPGPDATVCPFGDGKPGHSKGQQELLGNK